LRQVCAGKCAVAFLAACACAQALSAELPTTGAPERGPLRLVIALMGSVEAGLSRGDTGPTVRATQRDIVAVIDRLIGQLERPPQGGERASSLAQEGEEQPGQPQSASAIAEAEGEPAKESTVPEGDWEGEVEGAPMAARDSWMAGLPPAAREVVTQAFKDGRLPLRYSVLIGRYNTRLAEEEQ